MKKTTYQPTRRRFLQGMGTLIALPFLESLVPRSLRAAGVPAAQRLALFHGPCGIVQDHFFPTDFGTNFTLSPTLQPLAALRDDILILSNVYNGAAKNSPQKGGQGRHSEGMATLFTGAKLPLDAAGPVASTSVDQIFAQSLQNKTPVASLQLARAIDSGDCDPDYDCADIKTISWADAKTPLTPLTNAQNVFNKFFAGANPNISAAALAQRHALDKSILDSVLGQANDLRAKLSTNDAQRVDQYLTSVRALELQVAATPAASCAQKDPGTVDPNNIVQNATAMMDLMVVAFQCDLTRSIAFSFGNGHNDSFFSFLPNMTDGQHGLSHNDNPSVRKPQSAAIEAWEVSMIARFLQGIKDTQDTSGSILSNTVAVFSSELADGNAHNYDKLPVLVAGQGGGVVKTGRHLRVNGSGPQADIAQLWLGILQGFGVPVTTFGGFGVSTPLPGLSG